LRRQLGDFMKQKQKVLASPTSSIHGEEDEAVSNVMSSSSKGEPLRRGRRERRHPTNSNDFRVEIPKFDPDQFL